MKNLKSVSRRNSVFMSTYGQPSLALSVGKGARVWDEDGAVYIDLVAGIAVNALGHAHPAVVEAVTRQVGVLGHTSNLYANEPSIALGERLVDLFGDQASSGRVFFCNSGAEANEAAFKVARLTGRTKVVTVHESFHGRTLGALSLTGQPTKQFPFEPLVPGVENVAYGDIDALAAAVDSETAAVFLEPILGEGGVVVPPAGYLKAARQITRDAGALLVIDEVQTGIGRTGAWFGFQAENIEPDVVTLAKGLGGGLPIGACVAFGDAAGLMQPGMHGSTFGGNPVACSAALAVIDTISAENLLPRVAAAGMRLMLGLDAIQSDLVAGIRGRGLLIAIGINGGKAKAVQMAAQNAGFLINAINDDVIRIAPPLNISDSDIDLFVEAFPKILVEVQ